MKTLIVIDMQNDFVTGALGSKEAVAILPNVKKKITQYYAAGHEVIYTRDTHGEDYLNTSEGRHLPVPHCIKGTEGWEIVNGIKIYGAEYIDKPSFGYTDWDLIVSEDGSFKDRHFESIEIIGVCTDSRVANTCNLSEDWVGYSTRYGDSVGDFSPLSMLTTDEVIAVGKVCGLPTELVEKVPADGLCGKTDEDNLGFTYRMLNEYIRTGVCENEEIKERIDTKHKANLFKLKPMPVFDYSPTI